VVIDNLDVVRVSVPEPKANAPRPIDPNTPLALSIALQRMQANALERADVIESPSGIQDREKVHSRFDIKPSGPGLAALEQPPGRRISPGPYHRTKLLRFA
jgi:hypothetical protein